MGFDLQNFGIGLVSGWISAYGVYRARHAIRSAFETARGGASSAQNYATRSADSRYINDLIELCESSHLAGGFARLTEVIIEPRFLTAAALAAPPDDDVTYDVFYIVPQIHDLPYLHAFYNLDTLAIDELGSGSRAIALLGVPGSGRTTSLLAIALRSLGRLRFEQAIDKVQQQLDAEEAKLSEKERSQRKAERAKIEDRAKQELKEKHGMTFDIQMDRRQRVSESPFSQMMPVYIHLANVIIRGSEYGPQIDPAEPLVRAVQSQFGPITARAIPGNLYRRLDEGRVLLLLDGFDDLPADERVEKLTWLRALMAQYGSNFFIVAGPAQGYGALTQAGLTPIFLRPWNDVDQRKLVSRWAQAWPQIGKAGRKAAAPPDAALVERAQTNNRALSPLDLSLKIWSTFAADTQAVGFEGWLRAFIDRRLAHDPSTSVLLPRLAQAAALQLDEGFIRLDRLEALAQSAGASGAAMSVDDEALLDTLIGEPPPEQPSETQTGKKPPKGKEAEEVSAQGKLLNLLRRSGLLVSYRGGRDQFRHSFIAAYLASLTLKDARPEVLQTRALNPAWNQALAYASLHTSVEAAVRARLDAPPDVLHSGILDTARWLCYAGTGAAWSGPLLKQLGNMFIATNQFPLIRERSAAAMIGTRDKKTLYVFRQAARSASADVRRLACLAMGALGEAEAIGDLKALLVDDDNEVKLAAAMALGAIGTDQALEEMAVTLTAGSERLRQAAAETMAAIPDPGHPTLFEAVDHEDMMVRRAAVFGLRRISSPWSVAALFRAFLEDQQWYVRSAAQQGLIDLQNRDQKAPQAYPSADSLAWLANWAAERGESVPQGEAAAELLVKALQEGDADVKTLAAQVLGQLGTFSSARTLYAALRDRQEPVRAAAQRAIGDLELQMGEAFPPV